MNGTLWFRWNGLLRMQRNDDRHGVATVDERDNVEPWDCK